MTKSEAKNIEDQCNILLSDASGKICRLSWSLTNRLRINFENDFINMASDLKSAQYICYNGYYDDLIEDIDSIKQCITDNRELFDRLIWSYQHILELSEE